MAADGHLNFDTKINTSGFNKGIGSITRAADRLKGSVLKIGSAIAAAFSIKEIVENAAEVKALNAQFGQTFGSLQEQAQELIDGVAQSSQILDTRLKASASSIYAFARSNGMDSAAALNMMSEALQVTADSAAYYDRSLEETGETLRSFLKGNYANDAALGIACTETTRNIAANKLYGRSFQDLSEAQKQLTLLQMVKDANEMSGAMGQAAREADGWENVTGNLKETWKQLLSVIGQPVLSLAIPVIKQLTGALQELTNAAQSAVNALGTVFGFQLDAGGSELAESAAKAAESYSGMADAAEAAQEANEGSLAGFDQITKLGEKDSGTPESTAGTDITAAELSGAGAAADAVITETESKLTELFGKVKTSLEALFQPLKSSWDKYGAEILLDANALLDVFAKHGKNIFLSWIDWAGKLDLDPAFETFGHLEKSLAPFADTIGEGLEWFTKNVLQPLASWTIESLVPAFLNALADAVDGANTAWKTAEPVLKKRLWDKFLKPIAKWTGNTAVKLIKDLGSGIKDLGESITEKDVNVLLDLAEAIGAIFLTVKGTGLISAFSSSLKTFAAGAAPAVKMAFTNIGAEGGAALGTTLCAAVIAAVAGWGIGSAIYDKFGDEIDETLFPIFDKITAGFGIFLGGIGEMATETVPNIIEKIVSPFSSLAEFFTVTVPKWWESVKADKLFPLADKIAEVWTGIENFLTESIPNFFVETVPGFFESMWEDINNTAEEWSLALGQTAINAWNAVKSPFLTVGTWFKSKFSDAWKNIKSVFSVGTVNGHFTNVLNAVKTVFTNIGAWFYNKFSAAWTKIKEAFGLSSVKKHFESIVDKIGEAFSGLLGVIKAPVNAVIDAINGAFSTLNGLSIDIPHLDGSVTAWGFNIPEIPKLAQGTVVPANYGEFLAVLGDNKREAEVVSPVSAIKQAVMEAMAELGGIGGNGSAQPIVVQVMLGKKVLGQAVIDDINERTRLNGRSPLKT